MSSARPAVLLLGSFHMANPGLDRFNVEVDDVRSVRRRREIEQVVERLLRFQPSRVAVEVRPSRGDELDADYRTYRAGRFELPAGEVYQLGFRLAARSGCARLYPIDAMVSRDVDPLQWAAEHRQADLAEELTREWQTLANDGQEWLRQESVGEVLRRLNARDRAEREQALYVQLARIGTGDDYPGADWLGGWYERNLRIFANLTRITEPGDRILVVYGSGHIPLLRRFIEESALYDLEDVETYLA